MYFKRPSQRYTTPQEALTPFQKAGQLWDQRIGSARTQAKNWRLIAFGCLSLGFCLLVILFWQIKRSHIVPYIVEVNQFGEVRSVGPLSNSYDPTDPQIAWFLSQFISQVRSLSTDPILVRQNWLSAYAYVGPQAATFLNTYAQKRDPFSLIGTQSISVQVTSVVRASMTSFQVKWTETVFEKGSFSRSEYWTAILSTATQQPTTEEHLRKNPLGLIITAIDWSREIETQDMPQTKEHRP